MVTVTGVSTADIGQPSLTVAGSESAFGPSADTAGASGPSSTSAAIRPNLPVLANGDRGDDVRLLQQSLTALGYDVGPADGIFGDRTEAGVRAFQNDRRIGVDGIVGRGETWPNLLDSLTSRRDSLVQSTAGLPSAAPEVAAEIDRLDGLISRLSGGGSYTVQPGDTLSGIASRHGVSLTDLLAVNPQITNPNLIQPGQQINLPAGAGGPSTGGSPGGGTPNVDALVQAVPAGIRNANPEVAEHIERIVQVAQEEGLTQEQTAYVLATATHESHLGRFMEELSSGAQYENRPDLGNTQPGDGVRFKGRGYVQITGRANYQDWSNRLGIDLVGNPELSEDPDIAAQILVRGMRDGTFTGRRLDAYINESGTDFRNARRTVNGTDRADLIAGYAVDFNAALARSGSTGPAAAPVSAGNGGSVTVGPEGSDADLFLKRGADIDNLDRRVVDTFDDITAAWAAAGGPTPVITSGNDRRHSQGSLHYRDLAIDLRANNISDSLAQSIANDLSARLGADFDVIFERFPNNPANDHIHLEFDPS